MTLTQPRLSYEHDLIVLQYRYNSLWDFSNVCEIFLNKKHWNIYIYKISVLGAPQASKKQYFEGKTAQNWSKSI